ncbi:MULTISPECIES: YqiA/YcfP family alpha/beta fold hydrolase [Methylomicrobium]|uniref:Putative hydrolase of the alpha/beta superfamily n=1 Tax=Methylomicrobium album BG8 TaxID=686340 RepID=H8GM43_METAL|nr:MULTISPECIES: YqiA/YcfP family alpha/beta fold hydrolase [Methylomicrobium]EIC29404.1 putative hydrolase of the alpha/beta superfamily [Methylomicrobium album BG8]
MKKLLIYSHGKDSLPGGEKALAFAKAAESQGYRFESPDYRAQPDPDRRADQLLATGWRNFDRVVLVGSSMGAYVSAVAAETVKPAGLFLLAPAFYLPGYRQTAFTIPPDKTWVYHGWRDEIVPPEHAWRFCREYRVRLTMVDADHRLMGELPFIIQEFERFLRTIS